MASTPAPTSASNCRCPRTIQRRRWPRSLLSGAVALGCAALLSACQIFSSGVWSGNAEPATVEVASPLAAYTEMLRQLAAADAEGRGELLVRTQKRQAAQSDDPLRTLEWATALGAPGVPGGDAVRADQLLVELEANGDLGGDWPALLRLARANLALHRSADRQLSAAQRDNKALRKDLDDAQAKIKALTAIEQQLETPASRNAKPKP